MIKGHRSITDLDALHAMQHRILFDGALGVIEKIFTTVPTVDQIPAGYCALYESGSTRRIYFNFNGTIDYVNGETAIPEVDESKWEVDGTETQLITADEIDMQSKKIINVTDPVSNQDAATKKYVDDKIAGVGNTSNVIFCFGLGGGSHTADDHGVIVNDSITVANTNITTAYWASYDINGGAEYLETILTTKFKKIVGISTVTIWANVWQTSASECNRAMCKVIIGSLSGTANGSLNRITPEWITFDIDVSGLTNGTTYDVSIQLVATGNQVAYMDSIIGIAS